MECRAAESRRGEGLSDAADLWLTDQVAAAVRAAAAAASRPGGDQAALARSVALLRRVESGDGAPLAGGDLKALAALLAGRKLLALPPPLRTARFPGGLARALLALVAGLASLLPEGALLAPGGDPRTHLALAVTGPDAAWPPALLAALAGTPTPEPVAHALRIARLAGWRPTLLPGAGSEPPLLLFAASA